MFDSHVDGNDTALWDAAVESAAVGVLSGTGLLVIAPHPDDETLGAGGLMAEFSQRGLPVTVVIVTDGSPQADPSVIETRSREVRAAVELLAPGSELIELGFPDGATIEHRDEIRERLHVIVDAAPPTTHLVAPWPGDGHRDHRVVGELAAEVAGRRRLWGYPIWMWHWGSPDLARDGSWVRIPIDVDRKRRAIAAFASQVDGADPMLRESFLRHFERPYEVFVEHEPGSADSLGPEYFDDLYERRADPWRYLTRWYEQRKRSITVASLPRARYTTALEVGCSIGVLTADLASRCDDLLALDVSARAVQLARERVGDTARVEQIGQGAALPTGPFELIVLSEVGYYLDPTGWDAMLRQAVGSLAAGGDLVLCHWRHPVTDYPQTGDEVHQRAAATGLSRVVRHEEDDFVLEVYSTDGRSIARREGFA